MPATIKKEKFIGSQPGVCPAFLLCHQYVVDGKTPGGREDFKQLANIKEMLHHL
jgi:hypothetical protein